MITDTVTVKLDTLFSSIASSTRATADNTTLSDYDYWTMAIAVVACLVSVVSLYIARQTWKSQEKTERNTRMISIGTLSSLLLKLLGVAYTGFIRASVIKAKWSETGFAGFPHDDLIGYMKFPVDYVQAESCSDLEEDQFIALVQLRRVLDDYNERLVRRFANFRSVGVPVGMKERDISRMELEACWTIKRIIETIKVLNGSADVAEECIEALRVTSSAFCDDGSTPDKALSVRIPECVSILDGTFTDETFVRFKGMVEENLKVFHGRDKRNDEYVCIIS